MAANAISPRHHQKLEESELLMSKTYTLAYVKGQSFIGANRISELLHAAATYVAELEGETGCDIVVTAITPGYDEDLNPYVNVYYESI